MKQTVALEILSPQQLIHDLPGGIRSDQQIQQIDVCGANCPDRQPVVNDLLRLSQELGFEVRIISSGCHGAIGGCAVNGALECGAYVTIPVSSATGVVDSEVIVRSRS